MQRTGCEELTGQNVSGTCQLYMYNIKLPLVGQAERGKLCAATCKKDVAGRTLPERRATFNQDVLLPPSGYVARRNTQNVRLREKVLKNVHIQNVLPERNRKFLQYVTRTSGDVLFLRGELLVNKTVGDCCCKIAKLNNNNVPRCEYEHNYLRIGHRDYRGFGLLLLLHDTCNNLQ